MRSHGSNQHGGKQTSNGSISPIQLAVMETLESRQLLSGSPGSEMALPHALLTDAHIASPAKLTPEQVAANAAAKLAKKEAQAAAAAARKQAAIAKSIANFVKQITHEVRSHTKLATNVKFQTHIATEQANFARKIAKQGGSYTPIDFETLLVGASVTPAAPATVTATAISNTEIDLTWSSVTAAVGYKVDVSTDNGTTWNTLTTATGTSFANVGLTAYTTYKYQITTITSSASSAPSTAASATTLVNAPTNFAAVGASATTVSLTWTAVTGATTYKIDRSTNGSTWSTITPSPALGASSSSYSDTGLLAGTTYFYRISSLQGTATAGPAPGAIATTYPAAPVVTAAVISTSEIDLSWPAIQSAYAYKVETSADGGTTWVTQQNSAATAFAFTSLAADSTFKFRVSSINQTATVVSATVTAATLLNPPGGLVANVASASEIDLEWIAVTDATGYKVEKNSGTTWSVLAANDTSTAFAATGLTAGTTYSYRVSAIDASGTSVATTVVTATTLPAQPVITAPTVVSATEIDISWAAITGATYKVERSTDGGITWGVLAASQSAVTYKDTTCAADTAYKYRVTALVGSLSSIASASVGATTMLPGVTGFAATDASATEIDLSWKMLADATSYKIERAMGAAAYSTIVATQAANTDFYADTGLTPGTTYTYRISAVNSVGTSVTALSSAVVTLPPAPTLTVSGVTNTNAAFSWTASTSATQYNLQSSTDGGNTWTTTVVPSGLTYSMTSLTPDTAYTFRVIALDGSVQSLPSGLKTATTLLNAPASVTATVASTTEVDLAWALEVDATGYTVSRSSGTTWTTLTTTALAANVINYADTAAAAGTTYTYRVSAIDAAGTSAPTTTSVVTTLPATPVVTATVVSATEVDLSWVAITSATGYKIERSANAGSTYTQLVASQTTLTYKDTAATAGTAYTYRVTAINGTGSSVGGTTTATTILPAPSGFAGTIVSGTEIDLSWTAVAGAASYKIETSPNGSTLWTTVVAAQPGASTSYAATGLTTGTTYYYRISAIDSSSRASTTAASTALLTMPASPTLTATISSATSITLTWAAPTGAATYRLDRSSDGGTTWTSFSTISVLTYSDTGLTPNFNYRYRLTAINASGSSPVSAVVLANTSLTAPTSFAAVANTASSTELDLSWKVVATATSYKIERSADSGTTWITLSPTTALTGASVAYADTGLIPGTTYTYRISTINGVNGSVPSATITGLTIPASPVLSGVATSSTQLNLSWTASPSATGYKLETTTNGGTTWTTVITQAATTYNITGLTAATGYKYRVSATNASGTSSPSAVLSISTIVLAGSAFTTASTSNTAITLTWNIIPNTATYKLAQSSDGVTYTTITPTQTIGATTVSAPVTGLTAGTIYYFSLVAVSGTGVSAPALYAQGITLPATPTLTATPVSPTQVNLAWTASASATSYVVSESTDGGTTWAPIASPSNTTYSVTGLTTDTAYKFNISAVNASGASAASAGTSVTTLLNSPAGLGALIPSATEIDLSWTSVSDASSYKLERSVNGTTWTTIVPSVAFTSTSISYADTGLSPGTTYNYRISAVNANGTSLPCTPITVLTIPLTPTVTVTTVSATSLSVSWTASVGVATYQVQKSIDGGVTWANDGAAQTATTLVDTGLTADTIYKYRVSATNASGTSPFSSPVTGTTLLPAVTTVTATVASATEVDLSWTPVADAVSYKVERTPFGATTWTTLAAAVAAPGDTYADTSAAAGTSYTYRVSATNAIGTSAGTTTSAAVLTVPAVPTLTATVISPTAITLTVGSVASATGYKVEQSTNGGASWTTLSPNLASPPPSDPLTGLTAGTTYTFRVSALNTTGAGATCTPVSATTQYAAPASLNWTAASSTEIDLSWPIVAGATGYKIERSLNGTTWTTLVPSPALTGISNSYANTGLAAGTSYTYRISTISAGGTSSPLAPITAVTIPAAPTLSAVTASNTVINLTWNVPAGTVSFKVSRSADGGNTWTTLVASQAAATYTYSSTGLTSDTSYEYVVSAIDSGGTSVASNTVTNRTLLAAPTSLTASVASPTEIDLSWPAVTNAVDFKIERSLNGTSGWTTLSSTVLGSNTTYADTTVAGGTSYWYRISGIDAAGTSATTATASAALTLPTAPTVSSVATATTGVTLSWAAVVGATGYKIEKSADGGNTWTVLVPTQTTTSYAVTGLTADTSYKFRVSSIDTTGTSPTVVTQSTLLAAPATLTPTVVSATEIDLSWTAVTDAVSYKIERSINNSIWTTLAAAQAAGTTTYADTTALAGTNYYYRVSATDAAGTSLPVTTSELLTKPAAPTGVSGTVVSITQVNLTWSPVLSATSYKVEASTDGGTTYTVLNAAVTTTSYSATTLLADTAYKFVILANNNTGSSASSAAYNASTLENAPTGLSGWAAGSTSISLYWNSYTDATGYKVERSTNGTSGWTIIAANDANAQYTDTALATGTTYYYRVSAISTGGTSLPSSTFSIPTLPAAPQAAVASTTATSVTLTWPADVGATSYKVEINNGSWSLLAVPTTNTYTAVGLTADTAYSFRVSSTDSSGTGSPGAAVTVTTLLLSPAGLATSPQSATAINLSWTAETDAVSYKIERSADNSNWTTIAAAATGATYSDTTGLAGGTTYYYRISSTNANGTSAPSSTVTGLTDPPMPTLTLTAVSPTEIDASWNAAQSATSYILESYVSSAWTTINGSTPSATSYHNTGLTTDTVYSYRLTATNASGNSAVTAVGTDTTLLAAPTTFTTGTLTATSVGLTWDAETGATGYKVFRSLNGTTFSVIAANDSTNSYTDTGLTPNTSYVYYIESLDAGGASAQTGQVTPYTLPTTPASLAATETSYSSINLTWGAVSGATSYTLSTSSDGGTNWTTSSIPVSTSYADTGLTADTTYSFSLVAVAPHGTSASSTTATAITPLVSPAGLAATTISATEIDLAWTTETDATGYKVERSTNGSTGWATLAANDATNAYADTAVTAGNTYYYRISSISAGGTSVPETAINATAKPAVPTLAAVEASATSVNLTWNASNGATSYTLSTTSDAGTTWATASVPAGSSYTDTGLTPDTTYTFKLAANAANSQSSAASAVASATTPVIAPVGLAATEISATEIDLAWTTETDALTYKVERSLNGTSGWSTLTSTDATNAYADTAAGSGTTYYYRVSANSAGGTSAPSTNANSTTAPAAPTLTATAASATSVALSWNAPTGATSYSLTSSSDAGTNWTAVTLPVGTSYTNTGLTADTTYTYKLLAAIGSANSAAGTATVVTPLVTPVGLALTEPTPTEIDVAWTAETDATTYKVERSLTGTSGWTTLSSTVATNSYHDTTVTSGTTYYYRLSTNSVGGTSAATAAVSAVALPVAPTLSATVLGATSVKLGWSASLGATGYLVESTSDAGTNWTTVTTISSGATTTYTDNSVIADTTYTYRVSATVASESSATSVVAPVVTPVAAPAGVSAAAVSTTAITLTWTTETDATTYKVERSPNGTAQWTTLNAAAPSTVTTSTYADTGLSAGTTYYYRVSSNCVGGTSAPAAVVHAMTTPATPTLAAVVATDTSINLTWTPELGAVSYTLQSSTDAGTNWTTIASPTVAKYTDTGLLPDTTYTFQVQAVNGSQTSAQSTAVTAVTTLAAPTGITVAAASATSITVSWTAETDAVSYLIERSANGTSWTTAAAAATGTSYTDTGLTAGTGYIYRVSSTDAAGTSAATTPTTICLTDPAAPTLAANVISATQINFNWNTVASATGYTLQQTSDAGTNWTALATNQVGTTFVATGLTADQAYTFRVEALNASGASAFSTTVAKTTALLPPAGLTPTVVSSTSISLAWTAETDAVTYKVDRSSDGGVTWTTIAATDNTNSYTDTALTAGTLYYYRVASTNTNGVSAPATAVSATTVLVAPTGAAAVASTLAGQITVTWNAVVAAGLTGYLIQTSADGSTGWTTEGLVGSTATSFTDTHLTTSTVYYYRVVAVNAGGNSAPSAVVHATAP